MNRLTARNERKHRLTAMLYTFLVLAALGSALLFSGQLDEVIDAVMEMASPAGTDLPVDQSTPVAGV